MDQRPKAMKQFHLKRSVCKEITWAENIYDGGNHGELRIKYRPNKLPQFLNYGCHIEMLTGRGILIMLK